jgi:LAO/AO transport system kinase
VAFWVYLLRCGDGSYYAGHTDDLSTRMAQHETGTLGGYTATRKPVRLVWSQEVATRDEALAAELQIKGWSRAKKEALIAGDWDQIQRLAWGTKNPLPPKLAGASIPQPERNVDTVDGPPSPVRPEVSKGPLPLADEASSPVRAEVSKPLSDLASDVRQPGMPGRRALAKAITLLESSLPAHRAQADALLTACLPHSGGAVRLGLSGVPGVGKSSFIEALGLHLIQQGHRVAVLAIDPSSSLSGGSILGDKTRMERLSVQEAAFIRPSPSRGVLGGVASHTREVIRLVEAAGYDVVIVETVGVGQSEVAVAGMTDCFCLLQLPNAGDELQAIKRGVMELADLVVIHKADLDAAAAMRAQVQIVSSLRLHGQAHGAAAPIEVLQASSLTGQGVAEVWQAVLKQQAAQDRDQRRHQQDIAWLHERIQAGLQQAFHDHAAVAARLPGLEREVRAGTLAASTAARELMTLFLRNSTHG